MQKPLASSSFIALSLSFVRSEEKLLFNVRPSNESAIMDDTPPFIIIAAFITTQAPLPDKTDNLPCLVDPDVGGK